MGLTTKIEYADSSINPIMGCKGCELWAPDKGIKHCYAGKMIEHYAGRKGWPKSFGEPQFFPGRIETALSWKDLTGTRRKDKPWLNGMPRVIFVGDMGDVFGTSTDWLVDYLDVMSQSPHIWLFLTKRPAKMRDFFSKNFVDVLPKNFWLGVTVTDGRTLDLRLPELCDTPGVSIRWASFEPLLEDIDVDRFTRPRYDCQLIDTDDGTCRYDGNTTPECHVGTTGNLCKHKVYSGLDWIVCGAETGPGARETKTLWAKWLRDKAERSYIPFFLKKLSGGSSSLDGRAWRQMPEWRK